MTAITMKTAFICASDVRFRCIIRSEAHKTHGDHSSRSSIYLLLVELLDLGFFTSPVIVFGLVSPRIRSRHATISEM